MRTVHVCDVRVEFEHAAGFQDPSAVGSRQLSNLPVRQEAPCVSTYHRVDGGFIGTAGNQRMLWHSS